nr:hypothetical protein CFP56_65888 [Quercus suber]
MKVLSIGITAPAGKRILRTDGKGDGTSSSQDQFMVIYHDKLYRPGRRDGGKVPVWAFRPLLNYCPTALVVQDPKRSAGGAEDGAIARAETRAEVGSD